MEKLQYMVTVYSEDERGETSEYEYFDTLEEARAFEKQAKEWYSTTDVLVEEEPRKVEYFNRERRR